MGGNFIFHGLNSRYLLNNARPSGSHVCNRNYWTNGQVNFPSSVLNVSNYYTPGSYMNGYGTFGYSNYGHCCHNTSSGIGTGGALFALGLGVGAAFLTSDAGKPILSKVGNFFKNCWNKLTGN